MQKKKKKKWAAIPITDFSWMIEDKTRQKDFERTFWLSAQWLEHNMIIFIDKKILIGVAEVY